MTTGVVTLLKSDQIKFRNAEKINTKSGLYQRSFGKIFQKMRVKYECESFRERQKLFAGEIFPHLKNKGSRENHQK